MLFNKLEFAIFLPCVFSLYWLIKNLRFQNLFLVIASYIFYGWWDWRFLSLIFISSIIDFSIGLKLKLENNTSKRKILLWTSIILNLGMLGYFKYSNFFLENFISAFSFFGQDLQIATMEIILPVGISFYTFQTLSYTIDVYRKKLEPNHDLIGFLGFVSFFPQLVAGPIERASDLLPQFYKKRQFDHAKAVDGMRQILWGLFKKIVIADNCAEYANMIFNNSSDYSGSTLFLGAVFFTLQIYGDFSGYSDIAIGTSRLFGFNLKRNFAFPYFSRDIAEFWRRWHISLSTWFRDYLYIPLGGSKGNKMKIIRNTFIIFIVSGFWHGANWTFIAWGLLNALYFLPLLLLQKNRKNLDNPAANKFLPGLKELLQIGSTFILTVIAWVFFRAENIGHAFSYLSHMFSPSLFSKPQILPLTLFSLIVFFLGMEWVKRGKQHGLDLSNISSRAIRWTTYLLLVLAVFLFRGEQGDFIYFQF